MIKKDQLIHDDDMMVKKEKVKTSCLISADKSESLKDISPRNPVTNSFVSSNDTLSPDSNPIRSENSIIDLTYEEEDYFLEKRIQDIKQDLST